jgi:hypothetical protein
LHVADTNLEIPLFEAISGVGKIESDARGLIYRESAWLDWGLIESKNYLYGVTG